MNGLAPNSKWTDTQTLMNRRPYCPLCRRRARVLSIEPGSQKGTVKIFAECGYKAADHPYQFEVVEPE
jgi:hypothetical protein